MGAQKATVPPREAARSRTDDKPGFVPYFRRAVTIHLGPPLPTGSSGATRGDWMGHPRRYLALLRMGFTETAHVTAGPVGSYPTVSP